MLTAAPFAHAASLDIPALVRKSATVNARDLKASDDYAFDERNVKSKVDSAGHLKAEGSKTSQVLMIDGSPYRRLLAINDEPLSPSQQADEQTKLTREIAHRQNESAHDRAARVSKYEEQEAQERLFMDQMATAFQFTLLGEEQIDGHPCYHLKATPDPKYNPPVEKARVLKGMRGEMWIEKHGFHWAKVQADVIEPVSLFVFAKVNPGTRFELEQSPVGEFWLPKHFVQTVNASVLGVYGIRNQDEFFYSNYQENSSLLKAQASLH